MPRGASGDEHRYRFWLRSLGERGLNFETMLEHIWAYIQPQTAPENDDEFRYLICYVERANRNQGDLILRLCHAHSLSHWDSLVSRAGCVYIRVVLNVEAISAKLARLVRDAWYKYFYRVLSYKLTRCNKDEIREHFNLQMAGSQPPRHYPIQGRIEGLNELLMRNDLKRQATELYNWMMENWPRRSLNVLCYIYESDKGIPTTRLAAESKGNLYQLRSRMLRKLKALIRDKNGSPDAMRVLLEEFMEKMCQEVPESTTYRDRDEKDESDL